MLGEPQPARLSALIDHEQVEVHRSLFCWSYDRCLDAALIQRWTSWTCMHCPLFVPAQEIPGRPDRTAA